MIGDDEGHGRLDGKKKTVPLELKSCRFGFPKNPIDKTEFIIGFPEDTDKKIVKKAKADYEKIRKFLLRLTSAPKFENTLEWKKFTKMSFFQFLYEVGMFRESDDWTDVEAQRRARARYLTALRLIVNIHLIYIFFIDTLFRCEVKNSGLLLLKRQTEDIFTNNFNNKLMNIHRANMDIQFITDQYAVAQYITNYLTKLEGGATALMRNIYEEAIREGEAAKVSLAKLCKALDRGREVGIQEAIYRLLGLTMSKFSDVVRFINSAHPHRRDGLLKQNYQELPDSESPFHNSVHDYYTSRPRNSAEDNTDWEKMSLAEFASNYNIVQKQPKTERSQAFTLLNKKGYAVKRSSQCVLRYFLRYENEEEYHRALCVLFLPFRDEMVEIHSENVSELYERNQQQIELVRGQFEKHRHLTDLVDDLEKKPDNDLGEIDEAEEEQEGFKLEETTSPSDIEKYMKEARAVAERSLTSSHPMEKLPDDQYLEKVNSLNPEQRRIFDDIVERLMDITNPDQEPFYLYIGGEAGTGKSYLLRLLKEAAKRIPKSSGKELDKPLFLTMAPTGVAAYLIEGMTIESALGMGISGTRTFNPTSQSQNSQIAFTLEDLKVIFLDEVSMCGCNKLDKINLRLQEIFKNKLFMGGISLISFGDFGQLPPVKDLMVWKSSEVDGKTMLAPKLWDDNFKIYYMRMKMRSCDDEYSRICDQVRMGFKTDEISTYMNNRVKPCPSEDNLQLYQQGKFSIIVANNEDRKRINFEKLEKLIPNEDPVIIVSNDQATNVMNPPPLQKNLPLTQTGQLEREFTFKKGAPVMVTSNSQTAKYKQNGIVNGVRGFIDSFLFEEEDQTSVEVVYVRFTNDKIGQLLREDNLHYLQRHTPDDPLAVPIVRQTKPFNLKGGNTNWIRKQFPLTLCFAVTAHKVSH